MKSGYLYAGKILWADLSRGKVWTTPTVSFAQRFLGGRGIGIRILWEKTGPTKIDPLGPGNVLIFNTGPMTGTMMPGSGLCHICGKSPATGLLGSARLGGSFAPELKYAGYDHLVITGQAAEPVYLLIENEEVTIRPAGKFWGLDAYETPKALRRELKDEEIQWVCIGPAGEKLIRFATIAGSTSDSSGRTGLGAVMGSKKLKAVAVRGTGGLRVAKPDRFYEICAQVHDALRETAENSAVRTRPSRPGDEANRKTGCFGCPVRCVEVYPGPVMKESAVFYHWHAEMAAEIGVHDPTMWQKLAICVNRSGYDAASLGEVMAWATELYEQGILGEKEIGFPLHFGDGEAYLKLAQMIAGREGIGDLLAEGLIRASREIGRESRRYTNRQPVANEAGESSDTVHYYGHFAEVITDYRFAFSKGDAADADKIVTAEDTMGRAEILGSCKWLTEFNTMPVTAEVHAKVLSAGLGKEMTARELSIYQHRVGQLERAYDCREGLRRRHDTVSESCFSGSGRGGHIEEPLMDRDKFEAMKEYYYKLRGWDVVTGVPTRTTLESLGLSDIADDLERQGVLRSAQQR